MKYVVNDTLQLTDASYMTIAYFTIYGYDDTQSNTVNGYPTMEIYDYYINARHPLSYLSGPVQWDMTGFVNFIASVCASSPENFPFTLRGAGKNYTFYAVALTRMMGKESARQLSELFYDDNIIDILKAHLTFKELENG